MLIATRTLRLRQPANTEIAIRIFAPVQESNSWSCKIEVDWPDGTVALPIGGVDSIQALDLALRVVGAQLYASDHHASGNLVWEEPGKGYGFPVPTNIRDLLVGDDKRYM
jgi:hypothetical protein